jgi:hypothetical protein
MKKYPIKIVFIFALSLIASYSFAQIQSLHLLKYENSLNPIFSKKSKQIVISFDKNSLIDTPTKYYCSFKIDISDRKAELTGATNDISIGGAMTAMNNYGVLGGLLASGLSSSKSYSFRNTNGYVVLDRPKFDSLLKYAKSIVEIMDSKKGVQNYGQTYYFKVDKLELSLEVLKSTSLNADSEGGSNVSTYSVDKSIFLKIDESVFVFTDKEFKSLLNDSLLSVEYLWNNYN